MEEIVVDELSWFHLTSGWICTMDSNGVRCYSPSTDIEANKFWAAEYDARRRVASAICQMLTKSCSLPNARKIAAILHGRASQSQHQHAPALNIPNVTTEDLLIGIASAAGKGLNSHEIFEIMKAAASKQSDPVRALTGIAEDLHKLMNLRPTLWVKHDLAILDTETLMIKNNQFVMAAARNDVGKIEECLSMGQELTALHAEMKYTALHAAADFGAKDTLRCILQTGIPPNIRDARFGQTALHFAAQSGRAEMVQILLEFGADRMIPDMKGVLPYEAAGEHGYAVCREMLKEPPPAIMLASVVGCSASSISIAWQPPTTIKSQHALIEEYMIVHQAVTLIKPQGEERERDSADPNSADNWNPAKGYQRDEGLEMLYATDTKMTIHNLAASSGHSFLLLSRSAAGWSKPSAKLMHFTLPDVPSAPSKIELLKVNKNGLVVAWHPPVDDNGCKVTIYQLEMTDREPVFEDDSDLEDGDEQSVQVSLAHSDMGSSVGAMSASLAGSSVASSSNVSRQRNGVLDSQGGWHRLMKHRQVDNLEKYLMGLETDRNYYFRAQCKNEVGWSHWGHWSGPYMPQEGARVAEFGDMWLRLKWVAPVLCGRQVTAYEVQMCEPTGPRQNSLTVFAKRKKSDASQRSRLLSAGAATGVPPAQGDDKSVASCDSQATAGGYEFYTVDDDVRENQTVIEHLKPGIRYQFRVRPQIDGAWCNMNLIQMSDIIAVPASSPEAPTGVRVSTLAPTIFKRPTTGAAMAMGGERERELEQPDQDSLHGSPGQGPDEHASSLKYDEELWDTALSVHYNEDMKTPAIAHNSILLSWANGNPNGSPILENAIEMARVRGYNHEDAVLGLESSGKLQSGQFENSRLSLSGNLGDNSATNSDAAAEEMAIDSVLDWKEVTDRGVYVSSTSFRAQGLLPGCGHIFRIRQRNGVGWSEWSLASEPALTLAAPPPCAPTTFHLGSYHAVLEWADTADEFTYTILDFELQVALLPAGKRINGDSTDHDDSNWDIQLEWSVPETRREDVQKDGSTGAEEAGAGGEKGDGDIPSDNFNCRRVFVDKLSPMSIYVARVKVRTVTGWSAWSGIGKPFKTLSPP
jgi:hypothetical protein